MWKMFDRSDLNSAAEMEAFVRTHEKGHFTQMPSWGDVKTFWKWRGVTVYRQEGPAATMAVLIRPLPMGMSLLYVPRGPVCDREDPAIWGELMEALKQIAKEHHALLVYTDPDEPDSHGQFRSVIRKLGFRERADEGFGNIQPQYVFRLDLTTGNEEEIFRNFSSKIRYNIRLAQRKGVTVREYSGTDPMPDCVLEHFQALMETTGHRDHFGIRDLPYFRGLLSALQEDARIYIAYLQGQPIAGSIEVFCGRKAWYLYGASANEHRNVMPNYLLQWTMIRRAMERGCTLYDFRGVPGNPDGEDPLYGLYRFKKGFSGTYTKFTGLFTYAFRPVPGRLLEMAIRFRANRRQGARRK